MKVSKAPVLPSIPRRLTDDEDGSTSTGAAAVVKDSSSDDNQTKAYLFRYETMARQQQAEDMATVAHMNHCICRLMELLGMDVDVKEFNETFLCTEVSFEQLRLAFDILRQQEPREPMTTDRQLMMVLDMLTQKVDLKQPEQNASSPFVTWAEIVQCYKICVSGMVTLQHLEQHPNQRARARDRTLAMLSLFEPPSTQLFHEDAQSVRSSSTAMAALEQPVNVSRGKPRRSRKKPSMAGSIANGIGLCLAVVWLWNKSGYSCDPSNITRQHIALTQQGVPSHTVLEQQRNATEHLVFMATKVAGVVTEQLTSPATSESTSVQVERGESIENETIVASPTKISPSALLPHAHFSQVIGELFCLIVSQLRQRFAQDHGK